MAEDSKPTTAQANGEFWGHRARDWAEIQEGVARPAFQAALDRTDVGPSTRYLDIGCGAGLAASMAAERGADISGIDAAANMLEIARSRTSDGDFRIGDLEILPFEDSAFDVVTGFNSFQYAGNPGVALAEARRVVKPNGTVVIMTWGLPEGMEAAELVGAIKPLLPPSPPDAPGPFALSDERKLRSFASDAGLKPTEVFDVDCPWLFQDEATAIRGLLSSGVAARAIDVSGEAAVNAAYTEAIAPFRQSNGSYHIGCTFRCLLAQS